MENDLSLDQDALKIDQSEVLIRYVASCRKLSEESKFKISLTCSADIVAAVYYYRKYPDVNKFISEIWFFAWLFGLICPVFLLIVLLTQDFKVWYF